MSVKLNTKQIQQIVNALGDNNMDSDIKKPLSVWKRFTSFVFDLFISRNEKRLRLGPILYIFMVNTMAILGTLGWVIVAKLIEGKPVSDNLMLGFAGTLITFTINLISIYKHKKVKEETKVAAITQQDIASIPVIGPILASKMSTTDPKTGKPTATTSPSSPITHPSIKVDPKIKAGDNS